MGYEERNDPFLRSDASTARSRSDNEGFLDVPRILGEHEVVACQDKREESLVAVGVAEGGRCGSEEVVRWGSRALGAVCCALYWRCRIIDVLAERIAIRLRRKTCAGGDDDLVFGGGSGESRTVASIGANGRCLSRWSPDWDSAAVEPGFRISGG